MSWVQLTDPGCSDFSGSTPPSQLSSAVRLPPADTTESLLHNSSVSSFPICHRRLFVVWTPWCELPRSGQRGVCFDVQKQVTCCVDGAWRTCRRRPMTFPSAAHFAPRGDCQVEETIEEVIMWHHLKKCLFFKQGMRKLVLILRKRF